MRRKVLKIGLAMLAVTILSASAFAQGRGRGHGGDKRRDVFTSRDSRFDRRGRNQDWKCGVFVNCHDARDGRVDGRGPRTNSYYLRGSRVSYRNRYNLNDYWRRRHTTYGSGYYRMRRPR